MIVWFTGAAGTSISYEYNINYEWIPTVNKDLYGLSATPLGNPSLVPGMLRTGRTQPNPVAATVEALKAKISESVAKQV